MFCQSKLHKTWRSSYNLVAKYWLGHMPKLLHLNTLPFACNLVCFSKTNLLASMSFLAPGSAHIWTSARYPIDNTVPSFCHLELITILFSIWYTVPAYSLSCPVYNLVCVLYTVPFFCPFVLPLIKYTNLVANRCALSLVCHLAHLKILVSLW